MARAIDIKIHPDFTVDELIQYANWPIPSPMYRENLRRALDYFQQVVPKAVLRQEDDAGPWNLRINGVKFKLLNWLQGIDFREPVNPRRMVNKGDPLIAFKDPSIRPGQVRGNWYTFPSTRQGNVAIHSTQVRRTSSRRCRRSPACRARRRTPSSGGCATCRRSIAGAVRSSCSSGTRHGCWSRRDRVGRRRRRRSSS